MKTGLLSLHILLALCWTLNSGCRSTPILHPHNMQAGRGIRLAVQPECGRLSSGDFVNFNAGGIDLPQIKVMN
jgi:hypothetical protein